MPFKQPRPSPIEQAFWEVAKPLIPELQREVWIGRKYRVDFLIPSRKVVVELYGYQYHHTKKKLTQDAERERYLQRLGYQVIRFTGTEIYKDVRKCVDEVLLLTKIEPAPAAKHPLAAAPAPASRQGSDPPPTRTSTASTSPSVRQTPVPPSQPKESPRSGILWFLTSLLVSAVLVCTCGGVFLATYPSASRLSRPTGVVSLSGEAVPEFALRVSPATPDAGEQAALLRSLQAWHHSAAPDSRQYEVLFPARTPARLTLGWCAPDQATLDRQWSRLDFSLLIDDQYMDLNDRKWEGENDTGLCRGYTMFHPGWSPGRHAVLWLYRLEEPLESGSKNYPAGEYTLEFRIQTQ